MLQLMLYTSHYRLVLHVDWLQFHTPINTTWVILEAILPADLLVSIEETKTYCKTHTIQSFYGCSGFCPGLPRWAGTRKVKPGR